MLFLKAIAINEGLKSQKNQCSCINAMFQSINHIKVIYFNNVST